MNHYHVRSVRVTTDWFGTKCFYQPMIYDLGTSQYFPLKDYMDYPTIWGYETEADAWKIIDEKIMMDDYHDDCARISDPDREDFHSDG